jgi:hypothetical protein
VASRNAMNDNYSPNFNSGYLRIYDGTRPTNADTVLSGNNKLSELRFNATAFPSSSSGVLTANAITQDSSAALTGTATFARLFKSDGTTVLADISVGTSGTELVLATTSIVAGAIVQVSSLTITFPSTG